MRLARPHLYTYTICTATRCRAGATLLSAREYSRAARALRAAMRLLPCHSPVVRLTRCLSWRNGRDPHECWVFHGSVEHRARRCRTKPCNGLNFLRQGPSVHLVRKSTIGDLG